MHKGSKLLLPILATMALAACGDSTSSDNADVRVLLSRDGAAASLQASALSGLLAERVSLSSVDSLSVTVTAVEALSPATSDTTVADSAGKGERGWVTIDLPAPLSVNLMGLPTDTAGGFQLVRGTLAAGTYSRVRLVVADTAGFVVFRQPVTVGQSTFAAGQRVRLEVPSGKIKTAINFTVGADSASQLRLVFDPATTVRNVTATGSGRVKINPVLRARAGK